MSSRTSAGDAEGVDSGDAGSDAPLPTSTTVLAEPTAAPSPPPPPLPQATAAPPPPPAAAGAPAALASSFSSSTPSTSTASPTSTNPLLAHKVCRKRKQSLSTCYLSFGGVRLRASAMSGPARAQINLSRGPIVEDLATAAAAQLPLAHTAHTAAAAAAAQHGREGQHREGAEEEEEQRLGHAQVEAEEEEREEEEGRVSRSSAPRRGGGARKESASAASGAMTRRRAGAQTATSAVASLWLSPSTPPLSALPSIRRSSQRPSAPPFSVTDSSGSAATFHPDVRGVVGSTRLDSLASGASPSALHSSARSTFPSQTLSSPAPSFSPVKLEPATRPPLSPHSTPLPAPLQPASHSRSPLSAPPALPFRPRSASLASPSTSSPSSSSSASASASPPPPSPLPSSLSGSLPDCPVYHPTVLQWADPVRYLRSISAEAALWGMCRIVPPAGWSPPFALDSSKFRFTTRLQNLTTLQSGAAFLQGSREYTLRQFQLLAETFRQRALQRNRSPSAASAPSSPHPPTSPTSAAAAASEAGVLSTGEVESEYWRVVLHESRAVHVEYGADLDSSVHGSGFEALKLKGDVLVNAASLYAGSIGWNLRALPLLRGSLLGLLHEHVPGVSTPWLYVGMLFSSFCWHAEDSYLFSMNYLHCGASKTWYAAPGSQALRLQQAMRMHHPDVFAQQPDAQHSLTLQMSPHTLAARYAVDVCHTVQSAGEFVCTFPAAYHCGFSHGFNVGEAVNFAIAPWLPFGREAQELDRQHARSQCFSLHQLLLTMTINTIAAAEDDGLREDDGGRMDEPDNAAANGTAGAATGHLQSSTAPLSLSDAEQLLAELELVVAAEQRERTACVTAGVTRFVPLSSSSLSAVVPQCSICAVFCFLSFAQCERCRLSPVCLRHVDFACSCHGREALHVQYRYSIGQLSLLAQQLHAVITSSASSARKRKGSGAEPQRQQPSALPPSRASSRTSHASNIAGRNHSRSRHHHRSHSHRERHHHHRERRDGQTSKKKRDSSTDRRTADTAALPDHQGDE